MRVDMARNCRGRFALICAEVWLILRRRVRWHTTDSLGFGVHLISGIFQKKMGLRDKSFLDIVRISPIVLAERKHLRPEQEIQLELQACNSSGRRPGN